MHRPLRLLSCIPAALLGLSLAGCGGGVSGMFKGSGTTYPPVDPAAVKVVESKELMTESYVELGVARGKAPTAQQAVDAAKFHCAQRGGGNLLIMNTAPFQSDGRWSVDATCARTEGAPSRAGGRAPR
ncbi:MAG: hypothetical protein KC636_06405 [Myxococcales bacterium]|nr:hypothetical protein [Myxococcales bacterium]